MTPRRSMILVLILAPVAAMLAAPAVVGELSKPIIAAISAVTGVVP